MKRHLVTAVLFSLVGILLYSQESRWEYLVVSFGKAYFSEPTKDADALLKSKAVVYFGAGLNDFSEAIDIQSNIDLLGKKGWELISVVGQIGGDQEFIFKRVVNEKRQKEEATERQKQQKTVSNLILEAYNKEIVERSSSTHNITDDNDKKEVEEYYNNKQLETIKLALTEQKKYNIINYYYSPDKYYDGLTIYIDGTTELLKNKEYSQSEAAKYSQSAHSFFKSILIGNLKIEVDTYVYIDGNPEFIDKYYD